MKLAQRRHAIDSSGIRKVFDLAQSIKDPINLSIGLPDYDVPDAVKKIGLDAISEGKNRYTQTGGNKALRDAVRQFYTDNGVPHEDAMIASGTSGALFLCLLALLDPGDEVLIPDPYFVMYEALVKFLGAKPVLIDTYPDFRLTREALEAATTEKTRLLILNSPSNPTGVVMTADECRMVADFAELRGIEVLSDEIYEAFSYDGEFVRPSAFFKAPIVISGLSKSVAMTGWRLGWLVGPRDLIKATEEIQQYTFVCAPSVGQEMALHAMKFDMTPICEEYTRRRDLVYNGLVDNGYKVNKPGGAFYIFPEAPNRDGDAFVREAIEQRLLMVPGGVFSQRKSNFRISFAASEAKLREGLDILARLAEKHRS